MSAVESLSVHSQLHLCWMHETIMEIHSRYRQFLLVAVPIGREDIVAVAD